MSAHHWIPTIKLILTRGEDLPESFLNAVVKLTTDAMDEWPGSQAAELVAKICKSADEQIDDYLNLLAEDTGL